MCSTTALPPLHSFPRTPASVCGQSIRLPPPSSALCPTLPGYSISGAHAHAHAHAHAGHEPARLSGLRTPPSDDMSAAYQPAQLPSYDNHVAPSCSLAQASRAKAALTEAVRQSQYRDSRYPAQVQAHSHQHAYSLSHPISSSHSQIRSNGPSSGSSQHASAASRHSTRPSTPTSTGPLMGSQQDGSSSRRGSQAVALQGLQIPPSISPNGGSISDFAAQMTCLFWFESLDVLRAAENIRSRPPNTAIPRLMKCSTPYSQFKKWVYGVVSTTQVMENVILLALLFIYRLKMTNPNVKGRSGSEYRLLTVALMLGNKFLDDNTYTNKTWADVSGIGVQEIHVMEVEFLSNMRYSLLATKDQWDEWLAKLSCFLEYYERAQRFPGSPIVGPTANGAFTSPLPSPTGTLQNVTNLLPTTPSITTTFSPAVSAPPNSQPWPSYPTAPILSSPLSAKPTMAGRKRGLEDDPTEPPAKRSVRQPNLGPVTMAPGTVPRPTIVEPMRLPVPSLTLNTTAPSTYPAVSTGYAAQSVVSLPPLVPGVRAMATVYPSTQAPVVQQVPITTVAPPVPVAAYAPTAALPSHQPVLGYSTPTKRHSPTGGGLGPYVSSPVAEGFGVHTPISHTPISHSPSVYLQQRPSPYKPIRHVNTLLYPPPSASLHEYHLTVPPNQMHYQPLGRRNDLRTGIVPEFVGLQFRQAQQATSAQGQGQYPS